MRRILHLQHRRHTGKLLAHKHTSYRGLFVMVAVFAVALTFFYRAVEADELVTTAKVSAPAPTQAATVDSPTATNVVTTMPTAITGTCDFVTPASVVELYGDTDFLGSTTCASTGTYSMFVTLRAGVHRLLVRTVNITGDYGPDSAELIVSYEPEVETPVVDTSGKKTSSGTTARPVLIPDQSNQQSGLLIRSQYTYIVYGPAKDAEWAGYFEGGSSPYKVTVDWGDGTSSVYSNLSTDLQTFRHHYDDYISYFMTVTVADSNGESLRHQFAVVTPYVETPATTGTTSANWFDQEKRAIAFILYGTVATLAILIVLMMLHRTHPFLEPHRLAAAGHPPRKRRHR